MIRFVSFRSPTRGSPTRSSDPARRRDPSSITATVAPPSDRASARRRVAPARDRRDATREKPKKRKIETETENEPRPRRSRGRPGFRQNPIHWVNSLTRHKNRSVGHPRASPGVVARPANPHARDVERRGRSTGAGDGTRRGGASTTTRASDRRARGSARTARAGERRARDEGARAIGGEADDARRRRERDGTGEGDRTTTTTRTMGSR